MLRFSNQVSKLLNHMETVSVGVAKQFLKKKKKHKNNNEQCTCNEHMQVYLLVLSTCDLITYLNLKSGHVKYNNVL